MKTLLNLSLTLTLINPLDSWALRPQTDDGNPTATSANTGAPPTATSSSTTTGATGGATTGTPSTGSADQSFYSNTEAGLTDAEVKAAKEFDHAGYKERMKSEQCAKEGVNCAAGSDAPSGFMEHLSEHMGKAYTMIFGAGLGAIGGKGPTISVNKSAEAIKSQQKSADQAAAQAQRQGLGDGKAAKVDKTEDQTDYCMLAAMGWEGVMLLIQNGMNDNSQAETANIKDGQVRALVTLKKAHKNRQTTSTMQAVAYGAVSACYVAYLIPGVGNASLSSPMTYVKAGGAVFLATAYTLKANQHASAARAVQRVIDSLPDPGDCNPYTSKSCFCSEPTSQTLYPTEYMNVCIKKLDEDALVENVGCVAVDKAGTQAYDPNCTCKKNNSCFMTKITNPHPQFPEAANFMNNANQTFGLLDDGKVSGAISDYSPTGVSSALRKIKAKLPPRKLTEQQKKDAKIFEKTLPPALAAVAASSRPGLPPGGGTLGPAASLDNLSPENKEKIAKAIDAGYESNGGDEGSAVSEPGFTPPPMGAAAVEEDNAMIETFAEKATENADVSRSKDASLFESISNRYKLKSSSLGPTQ